MPKAFGASRLEQAVRGLLLLVIFALPFNVAWILSTSQAEVAGRYNQFAVPTLYPVELLVLLAGLGWLALRRHQIGLWPFRFLLVVIGLAVGSVLWAPYALLAGVTAFHLATAFLFMYVLVHELRDGSFARAAAGTLVATATLQAGWAISQFAVGHDLDLRWLGESALSHTTDNVAKLDNGHIRAYGSLPHPNVLAALLVPALFGLGTIIFWPLRQWQRWGVAALLALLGTALVLTFSRVALLIVLVNGLLVVAFNYRRWKRLPVAAAAAAAVVVVTTLIVWPQLAGRTAVESAQETGISNRQAGVELAVTMITDRPAGVGAGNFVLAAPQLEELPAYQYQPVHNVPLLIGAELGGVAAILVLWFVARLGWRFHNLRTRGERANAINFSLFAVAGVYLAIGMTDHFFWSLPIGLLLISLIVAAVVSRLSVRDQRTL